MSKLDRLRNAGGANVLASASPPAPGSRPPGMGAGQARFRGLRKAADTAWIPVDRIARDPGQPREEFEPESLARLADSMARRGQLQPIRVRWDEASGVYVVVCGERRWRAAKQAGLAELSCVVMEGPVSGAELLMIQVVENALREDLRPIEQARSYKMLMETQGLSMREVAAELHLSPSTVSKAVALLELPGGVQEQVERGVIAPDTAYEITKVDPAVRAEVAAQVVSGRMTRADIRDAVRRPASRAGRKLRVIRTKAGPRVTVEWSKGLDAAKVLEALAEAAEIITRERAA